jgi:site-specific recombinase XerD
VLKPLLDGIEPGGFVFSPRRELEQRSAERAKNRTTKYYASRQGWQQRKAKPDRAPGEAYTTASYGQAIRRAVAKANARRERLANGGGYDRVPAWAPNQLRHAHAALVRRVYGLDHVQATLGHASVLTSQIYATRRDELAAEVAFRLG